MIELSGLDTLTMIVITALMAAFVMWIIEEWRSK